MDWQDLWHWHLHGLRNISSPDTQTRLDRSIGGVMRMMGFATVVV